MNDDLEYCRAIESYLCRKNDGHLIRIVGPAFELVAGWAEKGVPFKVACRGIDRYFERYYAKAGRRRPVRIEFCDADVLDVFDEWKRAVGVSVARETADPSAAEETADGDGGPALRRSLPAHLERILARLSNRPPSGGPLDAAAATVRTELETMRASIKGARGAARQAVIDRLKALDDELLAAARGELDADALASAAAEADEELAPFRPRMLPEAYERARAACIDRIVRDRARLPVLAFE